MQHCLTPCWSRPIRAEVRVLSRTHQGVSMFERLAAVAFALFLALLLPISAASAAEGLDQAAVERIIKDYLLKNPEVLEEALNALQDKRAAEQAAQQKLAFEANKDKLFKSPSGAVFGNPNGNVTLVEFFDYNCGYCKRGLADILNLLDKDKNLRVIIKDFPVLGPGSLEAATVAVAVKQQLDGEKFLEFHKTLLSTRGPVAKDRALEVAQQSGVDMAKLNADIAGKTVRSIVTESLKLGDSLGISGTPSYVLGSELVVGAVGYDALRQKIESVRKCGQTVC